MVMKWATWLCSLLLATFDPLRLLYFHPTSLPHPYVFSFFLFTHKFVRNCVHTSYMNQENLYIPSFTHLCTHYIIPHLSLFLFTIQPSLSLSLLKCWNLFSTSQGGKKSKNKKKRGLCLWLFIETKSSLYL